MRQTFSGVFQAVCSRRTNKLITLITSHKLNGQRTHTHPHTNGPTRDAEQRTHTRLADEWACERELGALEPKKSTSQKQSRAPAGKLTTRQVQRLAWARGHSRSPPPRVPLCAPRLRHCPRRGGGGDGGVPNRTEPQRAEKQTSVVSSAMRTRDALARSFVHRSTWCFAIQHTKKRSLITLHVYSPLSHELVIRILNLHFASYLVFVRFPPPPRMRFLCLWWCLWWLCLSPCFCSDSASRSPTYNLFACAM